MTGNELTDLAAWQALVGSILPWVAAIVLRFNWPSSYKAVANAALCFVASVVTFGLEHGWHVDEHFVIALFTLYTTSQVLFRNIYRHVGLKEFAAKTG